MHGEGIDYAYGFWFAVTVNIGIFLFFAISFLIPRDRIEWRTFGIFTAFIAALFAEMYGFPMTIYILISLMGKNYPALNPFSHPAGHLILTFFGLERSGIAMTAIHIISNGLILAGFFVMSAGWKRIYTGAREGRLVTEGIYRYIRHPQYSGIFLITLGLLIQWPTLITLAMAPLLVAAYYRLARKEERKMEESFGGEYRRYIEKTPMFIPKWKAPAGRLSG